jgi:glycosyltransferase involved in cell wall biosynthesis
VKIASISHTASSAAPTGAERSLASLAESLVARGHEVAVIAPGPWSLSPSLRTGGIEIAEIRSRPCWLVQWGRQPIGRQLLRYVRWRAPDPGTRRMMVWLDHWWPDVVHVNCLPQLKGAAAAHALGLPVVWHVREIVPPGHRRRWFARRLSRHATRIVAVSDAVAAWIRDEGLGDRVTVVHNGVVPPGADVEPATARAGFGLPTDAVLVAFLGGTAVHKGAGLFIDAVERAMATNPDLHSVVPVYGPTAEIEALERRVGESAFVARHHLIPPVDDVFELLAAVDVVGFASVWPDSLPRVVMEAMSAGRPVVASRIGGVAEMVVDGETGLLVPPDDTDRLADCLIRLAGDAVLRQRLGAAATERARTAFSQEGHVDAMEAILTQAAG